MKNLRLRGFVIGLVTILVIGSVLFTPAASAQDCPELVGRWPYGPAFAVAVSGDYAYFGNGTALQVADVSVPATPLLVGEVVLPGIVRGVVVSGGYAYVADFDGGMSVFRDCSGSLFQDGFESGDPSAWSSFVGSAP